MVFNLVLVVSNPMLGLTFIKFLIGSVNPNNTPYTLIKFLNELIVLILYKQRI